LRSLLVCLLSLLLPLSLNGHTVSICAIFQNEAQWLKEWIEYHRLIGVEHFLLYNHQSSDEWQAVLEPYLNDGLVEVIDWSHAPFAIPKAQVSAYNDCLRRLSSEWIAFIDIDEFIVPAEEDSLADFLKQYEKFGGVVLNWRCFGTSGVDRLEEGELLIEKLTRSASPTALESHRIKSIVQPAKVRSCLNAHYFAYKPGYWAVNTEFARRDRSTSLPRYDRGWINHYKLRTREWAYGEKSRRIARYLESTYEKEIERTARSDEIYSEEEDLSIHRFVPKLKRALQPYITVVTMFQNEAQWLGEWIEYHLLVGVDHFLLYNHQSSDEWQTVLQPYIDQGVVTLVSAPKAPHVEAQYEVYELASKRLAGKTTWMACIDVDEFIVPTGAESLKQLLPPFESYGGIAINWRCFGTSSVERLLPGELMIEQLTWASKREADRSLFYKSIVRPDTLKSGHGVHSFEHKEGYETVQTDFRPPNGRVDFRTDRVCDDPVVLNHYFLRTKQWAFGEKLKRRARALSLTAKNARQYILDCDRAFSAEEDLRIQQFVPKLKERISR